MTSEESYPGGWFGPTWNAPVNEEATHRTTPVGEPCVRCGRPIQDGDRGMLIPHLGEGEMNLLAYGLNCWKDELLGPGWRNVPGAAS